MKLSARNVLKGKVKSIVVGSINDEVVIELPGGIEGAYAVIKASSVMVAVDD